MVSGTLAPLYTVFGLKLGCSGAAAPIGDEVLQNGEIFRPYVRTSVCTTVRYAVSKKQNFHQTFPLRTKKWRLDEDSALPKGKKSEKSRTIPDLAFLEENWTKYLLNSFTDIRYSTPKMTPLTISLLQLISNLTEIGISTISDHRGPHQSHKTATHTPKKQLFPQHLYFCG